MKRHALIVMAILISAFISTDCSLPPDWVFVLFEYRLGKCPAKGFELPERVDEASYLIGADTWHRQTYCHGFVRYKIYDHVEKKDYAHFHVQNTGDVFARFISGKSCMLYVVSSAGCTKHDTIDSCQAKLSKFGTTIQQYAKARADFFAQRIFSDYKFGVKMPGDGGKILGRGDAIESKCKEFTASLKGTI